MKNLMLMGAIITIILIGEGGYSLINAKGKVREEIKIKRQWKGYHCGYTEQAKLVIKTEEEWRKVWTKVKNSLLPLPELPEVNFGTDMIVAVFMGEKRTGGYSIEIERIMKKEEEIRIEVEEKYPSPDSVTTMALTQPYHMVAIPKFHLPVRFITKKDKK